MLINCKECNKVIYRKPSHVHEQNFCSRLCWKRGFVLSELSRRKIAITVSRVMTGTKRSPQARRNIALAKMGSRHPGWKGDSVGYKGLHHWISRNWGRSRYCEECKTTVAKKFEWANSGVYKRERKNWKRLCSSCHARLDKKINNIR